MGSLYSAVLTYVHIIEQNHFTFDNSKLVLDQKKMFTLLEDVTILSFFV